MKDAVSRNLPYELGGGKVDPQLYKRLCELYELIYQLQQAQSQVPQQTRAAVQQQLQLIGLLGPLGQSLIGQSSAPDPQLTNLQNTSGTVTSITFGAAFTGGTISTSGTVNLIIGTADTIQKSDGSKLVNSQITDDGTDINLACVSSITFGTPTLMTLDCVNKLVILTIANLPIVDPGVPGALWNNLGVINVSP